MNKYPKNIFTDYQKNTEKLLSPWAINSLKSKGRLVKEKTDDYRNLFKLIEIELYIQMPLED